tara:strand:- start:341 stop:583 length:243 start_codon:yes stop_codon:yes gene_type:complete
MSFNDRTQDVGYVLEMNIDDSFCFNMFQDGGAEIIRIADGECKRFELYEIKQYTGNTLFDRTFNESDLEQVIDEVYDKWT